MNSGTTESVTPKEPQSLAAQEKAEQSQAHFLATVYSFVVSLILAGAYVLCRYGASDLHLPEVLKALALCSAILFFPQSIRKFFNRQVSSSPDLTSVLSGEGILITGALVLTACLGTLVHGTAAIVTLVVISFATSLIGFVSGIGKCGDSFKNIFPWLSVLLISIWAAATLYACGWRGNPLFIEGLITNSKLIWPIDTLFHLSIANMIRWHGIPSTGLNGTPFYHYHVGSHWLLAQWSNLLDVRTVQCYVTVFPIVAFPLVLKSILTCAIELKSQLHANLDAFKSKVFWLIITAGFTALPDYFVHHNWRIDYPFNSESFAFSVVLSFLLLSTIIKSHKILSVNSQTKLASALFFGYICACACLIMLFKISTGAVIIPILLYFFLRFKLYKNLYGTAIVLAGIALIALVFTVVCSRSGSFYLVPFGYVRYYVSERWQHFYYLTNYGWLWLLIASEMTRNQIRNIKDLRQNFLGKRTVFLELALLVSVIGSVPGLILNLNGDTFFFANLHHWLCITLLAGIGLYLPKIHAPKWQNCYRAFASFIVLISVLNTADLTRKCIKFNRQIRTEISQIYTGGLAGWALNQDGNPGIECLQNLQALAKLPEDQKRSTTLYMPLSTTAYWQMLRCQQSPFIGPALSELAMTDGLPQASCNCWNHIYKEFGYLNYDRRKTDVAPTDEEIRAIAKRNGFERVVDMKGHPI